MRYLLTILISMLTVFCFYNASAQNTGVTYPTGATNQATPQKGGNGADSALVAPMISKERGAAYMTGGSSTLRVKSRIILDTTDNEMYYHNGTDWVSMSGIDSTTLADTAAAIRGDNTIKSTLLGTIYRAESWANLDTFYTPMSGINIDGGGNLSFTTGSASIDSFIGLDRHTLLDHWSMTGRFVVGAVSTTNYNGFGLGMRGTAGYERTVATFFNMSDNSVSGGKLYFNLDNNLVDNSDNKITFSAGDTIIYKCWYDYDKVGIFASVKNLTNDEVATLATTGAKLDARTPTDNIQLTYSSGYLSILPKGGSFVLDSLDISSKTLKYADLAIIGDSKSWNATVTNMTKYAWVKRMKSFYVNTAVLAGSGEWVIDVINRLPEVIELAPIQVLLNIGFNSFFGGVDPDTINAQYDMIVDSLENNGIRVIKMLPQYDQQDQSTLRTYILANYDEADIIDLYEATAACGDACLDINRIHPNDSGSAIIAEGILNSGKIWGAKGTEGVIDGAAIQWRADIGDSLLSKVDSVTKSNDSLFYWKGGSSSFVGVISGGSTPTLEEVTTAGATTSVATTFNANVSVGAQLQVTSTNKLKVNNYELQDRGVNTRHYGGEKQIEFLAVSGGSVNTNPIYYNNTFSCGNANANNVYFYGAVTATGTGTKTVGNLTPNLTINSTTGQNTNWYNNFSSAPVITSMHSTDKYASYVSLVSNDNRFYHFRGSNTVGSTFQFEVDYLGKVTTTGGVVSNKSTGYGSLIISTGYTPTSTADGNGSTGDVSWDANYIYIKTGAGWKRSALTTW